MPKWLIKARNEFMAEIICQRLMEGGVQPLSLGTSARPSSLAGGRDIYVEDRDIERAQGILKAAETVSEDELTKLSDEA